MRVVVRHGHFAFYPEARDDVLRFQRLFKLKLVAESDYYTLEGLVGLPRWSQVARPFGSLPANVTFEAPRPWDVMAANGFVYSLGLGSLIHYAAVAETVSLPQSLDYAIASKPLVQPGSILSGAAIPGNVLLGYSGTLDLSIQRLYVASVETLL